MSLLLPLARGRAEEFARTLERRTTSDPVAVSLFSLADELATMPVGPSAEFRSALRHQLVALAADPPPRVVRTTVADTLTSALSSWLTGWRGQRRLAFAAGLVAVLLLGGGIGLRSSRSAPGDVFYAVKRAAESAQLATAHGKLARGHRHLEFAATRLREVTALVDRNTASVAVGPGRVVAGRLALSEHSTKLVLSTLSEMDGEIVAGSRDLTEYWRESGQEPSLHTLDTFAKGQRVQLAAVLPALPVSARTSGLQVLARLSSVRQRAEALIAQPPCDTVCRSIARGPTMSDGFDVLGPLPCPTVCPGSGATPAPVAIITTVNPPEAPPAPLGTFSAEPPLSPSEPPPTSALPTVSTLPSPAETTSPPAPVETSAAPSPTPAPTPTPTPTESSSSPSPTDSPMSPTPSGAAPTGTGSPTPSASVLS